MRADALHALFESPHFYTLFRFACSRWTVQLTKYGGVESPVSVFVHSGFVFVQSAYIFMLAVLQRVVLPFLTL